MHDEDDELMLRLQGGDRQAFAELVQRHQSPLIGFFYRHLRDWQLGEDLSQETLLRIHNTAWDYLPRGLFKAWMYRIARNLLIDTTRWCGRYAAHRDETVRRAKTSLRCCRATSCSPASRPMKRN